MGRRPVKLRIAAVFYRGHRFSEENRKRLLDEAVALRAHVQGQSPTGKLCGQVERLRLGHALPCFDPYHRVFSEFRFI
jgi:hypothetical protein